MSVSANDGMDGEVKERLSNEPDWSTAQKAMRQNVRYVAALEQIKIILGRGSPAFGIADDALNGRA